MYWISWIKNIASTSSYRFLKDSLNNFSKFSLIISGDSIYKYDWYSTGIESNQYVITQTDFL